MSDFAVGIAMVASIAFPASAMADPSRTSYSAFGTPGLIDMPTAQSADDAELAATFSHFSGGTRATLSFQIAPRLSGSFRYSTIDNWVISTGEATFDRSFDLRFRMIDEGRIRPAIAVGLQDFIGTGIYSGEYVVATKHLSPSFAVTGGIGWGRLGSYNGFSNPLGALADGFKTRPSGTTGKGGQLESGKFFRGDAAFFGGVSWDVNERLTVKAEYSSDAYINETAKGRDLFQRRSPLNFGLDYKLNNTVHLQAYALHGDQVGFAATVLTNPRKPAFNGGTGPTPLPVQVRTKESVKSLGWTTDLGRAGRARGQTAQLLAADGMELEAIRLGSTSATIHIRNTRYLARAEAIGRTARILTRTLPASIEQITIVPMENGIPLSAVTINRSDIEELEFAPDGSWSSFARANISDAAGSLEGATYAADVYPRFRWSLSPYVAGSYFDPDSPVRLDLGAAVEASYDIAPGLTLSGRVRQRLVGNRDESKRDDPSELPRVRSDANIYDKADTAVTDLTLGYYFRPEQNVYARVTAGYLESMYAGISAEALWKPVDSRLGFGVELNHVWQRDFEGLGLQDYDITTGHASVYYDFGSGYHAQLDAGRYLAGDWGATLSVDRTFTNGWKVGAYATLTDVPFDDFGEGSFDKGIRITIPLDHFVGRPTGRTRTTTIQPILRDGGARVKVKGRLYESVKSYHEPDLRDSWGRFWR